MGVQTSATMKGLQRLYLYGKIALIFPLLTIGIVSAAELAVGYEVKPDAIVECSFNDFNRA
jgi:hypothetical protein